MKFKSLAPLVTAALALTVFAAGAQTQPQPASTDATASRHMHRAPDPDRQLQRMTKKFNLTDAQQQQIKPLLVDRQQKMMAIHNDTSLSTEQRRDSMRKTMQDSTAQIRNVLDEAQRKQFDDARERRREHRRGDTQAQPTTPPAAQ